MGSLREPPDPSPFRRLLGDALAAHERAAAASGDLALRLAAVRAHLEDDEASEAGSPPTPRLDEPDIPDEFAGLRPPTRAVSAAAAEATLAEATQAEASGADSAPAAQAETSGEARQRECVRRLMESEDSLWSTWHLREVSRPSRRMIPGSSEVPAEFGRVLAHLSAADGLQTLIISRPRTPLARRFVVLPDSVLRTSWDILSVLVLCYDAFLIPLSAFDVGVSGHFVLVHMFIAVFWTCDIGMSFISGYYEIGYLELRLPKIALRYMRGTFIFDVTVVSLDWMMTIFEALDGGAIRVLRMGRFLGAGKALRLIRMIRVVKMPGFLDDVKAAINSEVFSTALVFAKTFGLIALSNHFVACMWYMTSLTLRNDYSQPAWIDGLIDEGSRNTGYFYATALHWSVTQFTPASMEVQPRNTAERVFAICIIFGALVVFSSFISGITSAMTHLRQYYAHSYDQSEKIRRYVIDKGISHELTRRVALFIRKYEVLAKRRVCEQDVEAFSALPTAMRTRLRLEAHGPVLVTQPFFYQVKEFDATGLIRVCSSTITETHMDVAHELFEPDQDALEAYFFLHGHVEYLNDWADAERFVARDHHNNREGRFGVFCEAALWVRFQHPGRIFCRTASLFLALSSASLRSVATTRPGLHRACCAYAAAFQGALRESLPEIDQYDLGLRSFDLVQEMAQKAFEDGFGALGSESLGGPDVASSSSKRRVFGLRDGRAARFVLRARSSRGSEGRRGSSEGRRGSGLSADSR